MDFAIPQFEYPLVLLLISPLILAGIYAIRRGVSKWIIFSRIIILSLLIIALASPYSVGISTVKDDAPRITVISDKTLSMDLFNMDMGQKLFTALQPKTPTKYAEFAGVKSPIGDEVIGASENNNLVLVTDGNNNYGKDLFDAISFVSRAGTRVFAVKQKPLHNDASVEIASAKNIIIGNENVFNVVVRQAGTDISYRLDVDIDGTSFMSNSITQTEREKVIPFTYTFTTLGSHRMTATITPSTEDRFNLNNVFYKSVFVVPKPKVLAVTEDTASALYYVTNKLYDATTMTSLPSDLSSYKAVIIDNKGAGELPADTLRNYVGNGGGLVVVGGDSSYDKGSYNNSPVEAILPIISRAGEFKGGQNVVLVLDSSGSTAIAMSQVIGGTPVSGNAEIMAIAKNIVLKSKQDASIGIVAFGASTTATIPLTKMNPVNKQTMSDKIEFAPGSENVGTNLDMGLSSAFDMLRSITGSKEVIVISDGQIESIYGKSLSIGLEMKNAGINFNFIQVNANVEADTNPKYKDLATNLNAELISAPTSYRPSPLEESSTAQPSTAQPTPAPTPTYDYPLAAIDTNHFITKYFNITASVTGYNDVTPKLGSDELVATTRGKPILTTWGFGLGRVVSFTTDNGANENNCYSGSPVTCWASEVYSGRNSQLISSMINWAIGDPRPQGGVVIQADDIWAGTAGRVIVTSDTLPQVQLDKAPLDLSRTGPTTYETSINLETGNFHDISGYGIAVNYPLEYREIGFNDELVQVIESNGGSVYNEDDVQGLLFLDIKEKAVRTVNEPKSEKEPYLLAALVLFLTEVIIRRMKDYRKDRPVMEENPPRTEQVAE
jgi:uncharacterized membrane protein